MMAKAPPPRVGSAQGGVRVGAEDDVSRKLHAIYLQQIKPLEDMYNYDVFKPTWFEETILNPRPFVTFFGPWSSGKSTFINYLLQDNYLWTGPQPTTAKFTVVVHGKEPGPLDGHALVNAKNLPFKGLNSFGEDFLQNFQGFQAPHPLLEKITLIDTPGVLDGANTVHKRPYDYVKVSRWFVERSDLVFFLFDPAKLDAGNELRQMFTGALKGQESKLRIILNKADTVDTQSLMRVYGSLFWNLSNIVSTTEPPRVYVGSFWDQPYKEGSFTLLFSEEKMDLLHELIEIIPQQARDKKIAQVIRRAKDVLVHAGLVGGMRSDLPLLFGKGKAKRKALENLPKTYEIVGSKYKMNYKDFPPVEQYRDFLSKFDVEKFPELGKAEKRGLISGIRDCIDTVLPAMLRPVKNYGPSNPRSTPEADDLKRRYYDAVRGQYEGREGIQGSTDIVAPASRPVAIVRGALDSTQAPSPNPPPPQQTPQTDPPNSVSEAQMQAVLRDLMATRHRAGPTSQGPQPPLPAVVDAAQAAAPATVVQHRGNGPTHNSINTGSSTTAIAAAAVPERQHPQREEISDLWGGPVAVEEIDTASGSDSDSAPATVVANGGRTPMEDEPERPVPAAGAAAARADFSYIETPSKQ